MACHPFRVSNRRMHNGTTTIHNDISFALILGTPKWASDAWRTKREKKRRDNDRQTTAVSATAERRTHKRNSMHAKCTHSSLFFASFSSLFGFPFLDLRCDAAVTFLAFRVFFFFFLFRWDTESVEYLKREEFNWTKNDVFVSDSFWKRMESIEEPADDHRRDSVNKEFLFTFSTALAGGRQTGRNKQNKRISCLSTRRIRYSLCGG